MFLTAVFAIFNVNNLNLYQRNSDINKNRFNCKTFTTEILDISGLDKILVEWQRLHIHTFTSTTVNTSSETV